MPRYRIAHIEGANMHLKETFAEIVEADSFTEALRTRTDWPIFESRDRRTAAADNPGKCVYQTEMWEATLLDPLAAQTDSPYLGDWSRMRY